MIDKTLQKVLDEMSKRVGAGKIDPTKENWFQEYSWTKEEEEDFKAWLSDFFKKNHHILNMRPRNKKDRDKAAMKFIFNYGWKVL